MALSLLDPQIAEFHRALGIPPEYESQTKLSKHEVPTQLVSIGADIYGRDQRLRMDAARSWQSMKLAASNDSIELLVVSAFRSPSYQVEVIQRQLDRGRTIDDILSQVAAPGFSEHHSGRAMDLTTFGYEAVETEFENSPAFDWLTREAASFGFRLSYPRNNPYGVVYEPWHWCFHAD